MKKTTKAKETRHEKKSLKQCIIKILTSVEGVIVDACVRIKFDVKQIEYLSNRWMRDFIKELKKEDQKNDN